MDIEKINSDIIIKQTEINQERDSTNKIELQKQLSILKFRKEVAVIQQKIKQLA